MSEISASTIFLLMLHTLFWRDHALQYYCSWTKPWTRIVSQHFLLLSMLPGTGLITRNSRMWHYEFKMGWNVYSTQEAHISQHGCGYIMWIGVGLDDQLTISQNIRRRGPRQLRCTMRFCVDSVGWPTTLFVHMQKMSMPWVTITELRCVRHREWGTWMLYTYYFSTMPMSMTPEAPGTGRRCTRHRTVAIRRSSSSSSNTELKSTQYPRPTIPPCGARRMRDIWR